MPSIEVILVVSFAGITAAGIVFCAVAIFCKDDPVTQAGAADDWHVDHDCDGRECARSLVACPRAGICSGASPMNAGGMHKVTFDIKN